MLTDKTIAFLLLAACVIGFWVFMTVTRAGMGARRRRSWPKPDEASTRSKATPWADRHDRAGLGNKLTDPFDQLRAVAAAEFKRKKVMRPEEYRVFRVVEEEVLGWCEGHRVFAQTSLGEIIRSENPQAHSSINSKRVDILIIASNGYPLVAIEYQGGGHHQSLAAARDAVKKEALRKAGVGLLEVLPSHGAEDIRRMVRHAVAQRQRTDSPAPARLVPAAQGDGAAATFGNRRNGQFRAAAVMPPPSPQT